MTLHADAVSVLASWTPPDAGQDRLRRRYLDHLDGHPDAMLRSCSPDHLTASALVMSRDGARVLLTLHRRLRRWLQTGGHCEPTDRTLASAAAREAAEESGIEELSLDPAPVVLSRHEVPCGPMRPAHHLDVQFVAFAADDARERISDESEDLRWFPVDALPEDADASVRTLVRLAAARAEPA